MYFEHYHLKRKPFGLTPAPDFFWLSEKHQEALATLRYGVLGDLGFLLLTGEVGVGKTALIHRLLSSLDSSTIVAHITDPALGINDFFRLLAVELGIDTPFSSKGEFLIILERFLREADNNQKKVLLIVDEVQRINNSLLDQIRVLSNIELDDRKLINIFLIGQPEIKNILLSPANKPIRQRIAIYYHVEPLTEAETAQYITHRLTIAGASHEIFTFDAIHEIHRISNGFPRAINILCDHSLLTGFSSGTQTINSGIVKECESELNIDTVIDFPAVAPKRRPTTDTPTHPPSHKPVPVPTASPPSRMWIYALGIAFCIVLVGVAGYHFLGSSPGNRQPTLAVSNLQGQQRSNSQADENLPQDKGLKSYTVTVPKDAGKQIDSTLDTDPSHIVPTTVPDAGTSPLAPMPTPSPRLTMSTAQAAPEAPESPGKDESMASEEPAPDQVDAKTSLESADSRETDDSKQSRSAYNPVSPGVLSSPTVAVNLEATQIPKTVPNKAPVEQAIQKPTSPAQAASPERRSPPPDKAIKTAGNDSSAGKADVPPASSPRPGAIAEPTPEDLRPPSDNGSVSKLSAAAEAPVTKPTAVSQPVTTVAPAITQPVGESTRAAPLTPPVVTLPTTPSGPAVPAMAALQPQDAQKETATADKPESNEAIKTRLRAFLKTYCQTYSAKDLDSFIDFFAPGATENGKPFESLLPKYQRNFTFIDAINYRIELQNVTREDDGEMLRVDGNFFLRWLLPGKKWRENTGKIYMTLEEKGSSYQVHNLEYHGHRSN